MRSMLAAARILASIIALGAVAVRTDFGALIDIVGDANPAWIAGALVVNLVAVGGSIALWRMMLPRGEAPPAWFLLRAYFAGLFVNNVGLGTVLGDSLRSGELAQHMPVGRAVVSVFAERMLSLVALCALASVGAVYVAPAHPQLAVVVWGASISVLLGLIAIYRLNARIGRAAWLPDVIRPSIAEAEAAVRALLQQPARLAFGMGIALCVQLCTVIATILVTRSLGASLPPWQALAVVPMIAFTVQLPVSVQGIGVREGAYILFLGLVGVASEVALAAALLSYATTLVVSMMGGVVLLQRIVIRRDGARPPQHRDDEQPALRHAA